MSYLISLVVGIIITNAATVICAHYLKEPWHTSMFTGQMWILELLAGHPECICTELGVHQHVFYALIEELHELGHTNSKYVTLEEQLIIFLYCLVTGLTVRHLGERFQRSNDTIAWHPTVSPAPTNRRLRLSHHLQHQLCHFIPPLPIAQKLPVSHTLKAHEVYCSIISGYLRQQWETLNQ